ncbi:MAG: helix-turn-helix domain-containing protein [Desulfobacterales bacterium]|jgi:hypothetical protein
MAQNIQFLTTGEFGSKTGMSAAQVSKRIRQGEIKAKKKSGKWMIHPGELEAIAVQDLDGGRQSTVATAAAKTSQEKSTPTPSGRKSFTLSEFVEMTYLTALGVKQWIKQGHLMARQNEKGEWLINAENLQTPNIKRLIREG